jgi:two-component system sensor histidine kinase QseC
MTHRQRLNRWFQKLSLQNLKASGPGVADQDYERISQRFYRCVETAQSAEGSGLGLSIVQRIIRLHAASIRFSKSGLGGLNATLWFDLADLSD